MREFVSEIIVEWAHCDAAQIVFYPNFYIWFDQGTERLFSANNLSYNELAQDFGIGGMPLVETGAVYKSPCKLGSELKMTTWVEEWAGKTFLVKHRVMHGTGNEALEGFERRVMVLNDPNLPKGMRAIETPKEIRDRFAG